MRTLEKRHLILSLIIVILSMSCVSAGLFDGLFGGDDNKNITLIKTITDTFNMGNMKINE